jgi:MFS family permease
MLNLVDRGVMMLLLQPIKVDLHLSDTQLGFLTGIAFGLFYAVLGLPLARWADRGDRANLTSLAIGLWGLTVMACLFVASYAQLVFARIAAAIGESGCKPPTYSLLGDYFPERTERTRAMAVYTAANYLSSLISFAVGGWLNELYGWRLTFFVMGIPGLVLAVVVRCTIREPRKQIDSARVERTAPPSMKTVLILLWRRRACRHLGIALILLYTMTLGLGPWQAAFMMRMHKMGTAELGVWLGLIFALGGITGALLSGYLVQRWIGEDDKRQIRGNAIALASVTPFFIGFLLVPNRYVALLALIPSTMVLGGVLGTSYALMQRLVPDDMRATVLAVLMLLANVIGFGVGPQVVGIMSDLLTPVLGSDALRYAMLAMCFVAVWGAYHFWLVGKTIEIDLEARSADGESATIDREEPRTVQLVGGSSRTGGVQGLRR